MSEKKEKNARCPDLEFAQAISAANGNNQFMHRGPFKMFCSENNGLQQISVYEWVKNHWSMMNDLQGKLLVSDWLQKDSYFAGQISDKKCSLIWDYARTMLTKSNCAVIGTEQDLNSVGEIVFPTINHYLVLKNGKFMIEKPNPNYHMRYVIQLDLSPYILDHETEYAPSIEIPHDCYFERFIRGAFPEQAVERVVQEFVGAAFFKTSFQKCLWLYGGGSNGKSTLLDLIKHIIPNGYRAGDLGRLHGDFDLHSLMDAAIIGVPEVEDSKLPEGRLKSLISGDEIPVNRKNKDVINHRFLAKWFICSNNIPHFNDKSDGWFRRFVWVKVENKISDSNQIINIKDLIIKKDMLCFFDWVLMGALSIAKRGHIVGDAEMPLSLQICKQQLRWQNNSVAQWFEISGLRVTVSESEYASRADIYGRYRDFCAQELMKEAIGVEKFWNEMERLNNMKGQHIISVQKMALKKRSYYSNLTFLPVNQSVLDIVLELDGVANAE